MSKHVLSAGKDFRTAAMRTLPAFLNALWAAALVSDGMGERVKSRATTSSDSGLYLHAATTAGGNGLSSDKSLSAAWAPCREPPASDSQTPRSGHLDILRRLSCIACAKAKIMIRYRVDLTAKRLRTIGGAAVSSIGMATN